MAELQYLAFPQVPGLSCPILGYHSNVGDCFPLLEHVWNLIRYRLTTPPSIVPLLQEHILHAGLHCRERLQSWIGVLPFSFSSTQSTFKYYKGEGFRWTSAWHLCVQWIALWIELQVLPSARVFLSDCGEQTIDCIVWGFLWGFLYNNSVICNPFLAREASFSEKKEPVGGSISTLFGHFIKITFIHVYISRSFYSISFPSNSSNGPLV